MKNRAVKKTAGRWSKLEHKLFEEGIELYGDNWEAIEDHVGTRTAAQIRNHCLKSKGTLNVSMKRQKVQTDIDSMRVIQAPAWST